MPATTPAGIPYVLPTDKPVEFPTHSQALANAVSAGQQSTWTPAAQWVDFGGSSAGLWVTRIGPLVLVEGTAKRTAALTVAANTLYTMGTIPAGYRPAHLATQISDSLLAGGLKFVEISVTAAGVLQFVSPTAGTMAINEYVIVAIAYRGA